MRFFHSKKEEYFIDCEMIHKIKSRNRELVVTPMRSGAKLGESPETESRSSRRCDPEQNWEKVPKQRAGRHADAIRIGIRKNKGGSANHRRERLYFGSRGFVYYFLETCGYFGSGFCIREFPKAGSYLFLNFFTSADSVYN